MPHDDDQQNAYLSWRSLAVGACGLILTVGGLAIGLWSQSLDQRLDDIASSQRKQWEVLNQRANLDPRLGSIERQTADQELRLREVERRMWRQGH